MRNIQNNDPDIPEDDLKAYFGDNATPGQLQRVRHWMKGCEGQAYLSKMMDEDIALAGKGENRIVIPENIPSIKMLKGINHALNKRKRIKTISIAAAVMVPFLLVNLLLSLHFGAPGDNRITYKSIFVPAGEQLRVVLSDGTNVMLNSGTTLEYPTRFHRKYRTVKLDGEAYFEVSGNRRQPFTVETPEVSVNVLGTKFNINTDDKDDITSVYLTEGSVRLVENVSGTFSGHMLKPGELALVQKSSGKLYVENIEDNGNTIGWIHKRYYFKDAPLAEVIRLLEKNYGVVIKVESPALYGYTYTMNFTNESIDDILYQMECITPIRCVNSNGRITIYHR